MRWPAIDARVIDNFVQSLIHFVPRLVTGAGIFLGFWIAGVVVEYVVSRFDRKVGEGRKDVFQFLAKIVKTCVLVFGAVTALGTLGINVSALVAGLGLTGFALGFALKDVLSNLLAGMLILIYRPFRINDRILVTGANLEGLVIHIDLRYTVLQNEDKLLLVPNSMLFTNALVKSLRKPGVPASNVPVEMPAPR